MGEKFISFCSEIRLWLKKTFENTNPLGILVESTIGIKNLSNLLSNKMIDFVYFGAYDLSVEYQILGQIFDEKILYDLRKLKKLP